MAKGLLDLVVENNQGPQPALHATDLVKGADGGRLGSARQIHTLVGGWPLRNAHLNLRHDADSEMWTNTSSAAAMAERIMEYEELAASLELEALIRGRRS